MEVVKEAIERSVLVCYGERRRVVKLPATSVGSELDSLRVSAIRTFSDVLPAFLISENAEMTTTILFQLQDNEWGGLFVDVDGAEAIPDKSVVKMIIDPDHSGSQPHTAAYSFGGESSEVESSTTASLQSTTTSMVSVDYKTIAFMLLLGMFRLNSGESI